MEYFTLDKNNQTREFIKACDEMINGKFILADVKIMKILNAIANCEPIYRYVQECLIDFNFEKEYARAGVKNQFSNENFSAPTNQKQLVAMVFSLLVEFDKKQIDFYKFVTTNFATLNKGGEYENFVNALIVPFKNAIAQNFGLVQKQENVEHANKIAEQTPQQNKSVEQNLTEPTELEKLDEEQQIWKNIGLLVDNVIQAVSVDRKLKGDAKEQCLYALKSIKYSFKYKDMRLVSSLFMAVQVLTQKSRSLGFVLNEIKTEINKYYNLKTK